MKWRPWRPRVSPEARRAVQISQQHLDETRARWEKVNDVTARVDGLMRRNHFAESIAYAMRERRR